MKTFYFYLLFVLAVMIFPLNLGFGLFLLSPFFILQAVLQLNVILRLKDRNKTAQQFLCVSLFIFLLFSLFRADTHTIGGSNDTVYTSFGIIIKGFGAFDFDCKFQEWIDSDIYRLFNIFLYLASVGLNITLFFIYPRQKEL